MKKTCPICGQKNLTDPDSPKHVTSKRHLVALGEVGRSSKKADTGSISLNTAKMRDDLENALAGIDQKLDLLSQRINDISEKLNYLLASSAATTSPKKNIFVTPDFLDFIMKSTSDISDIEVLAVLGSHTFGIVVSIFDQNQGPVPITVIPESLKENYNLLLNLVDLSFSNCQILDDFENESSAAFELSLGGGYFINCISFGFSLERPQVRGGAENVTVSILVNNDIFSLVSQFNSYIKEKVHEIHGLMNKHRDDKDRLVLALLDLRKLVSFIVLSYNRTYSYSKMKDL